MTQGPQDGHGDDRGRDGGRNGHADLKPEINICRGENEGDQRANEEAATCKLSFYRHRRAIVFSLALWRVTFNSCGD